MLSCSLGHTILISSPPRRTLLISISINLHRKHFSNSFPSPTRHINLSSSSRKKSSSSYNNSFPLGAKSSPISPRSLSKDNGMEPFQRRGNKSSKSAPHPIANRIKVKINRSQTSNLQEHESGEQDNCLC